MGHHSQHVQQPLQYSQSLGYCGTSGGGHTYSPNGQNELINIGGHVTHQQRHSIQLPVQYAQGHFGAMPIGAGGSTHSYGGSQSVSYWLYCFISNFFSFINIINKQNFVSIVLSVFRDRLPTHKQNRHILVRTVRQRRPIRKAPLNKVKVHLDRPIILCRIKCKILTL